MARKKKPRKRRVKKPAPPQKDQQFFEGPNDSERFEQPHPPWTEAHDRNDNPWAKMDEEDSM